MNISNDGGGLSMTGVDTNESSVSGVDDRVVKIETLIKQFEMYRLPLLLDVKSSNGFGKNPPYEVVPFINFLSPLQIRTINVPDFVDGTAFPLIINLNNKKNIQFSGASHNATFNCDTYFHYTKDSIYEKMEIGELINKTLDIEAEQAEEEAKINALDTKVSSYDAKITKITADNAALDLKVSSFDSAIKNNTSLISASTANISKNTSDILQNKTAIDNNTAKISKNALDIANNTSLISAKDTNISKNTTDIAQNTLAISNNTNTIAQNTKDIAQNTTDIAQNTTDIAQNTTDIAQNTTKINNTIKEFTAASTLINSSLKGIYTALTFTIPLTLRPTDGQFLFYNGLHTKYISHMDNYTIYSITMLITDSNFEINKNLATGTKLEAVLKLDFYGTSLNPGLADELRDTSSTTITIDRTNPGSRIIKVNKPLAINSYINAEEERRRYLKASLIRISTNHILADFILNAKQ